MPIRPDYEGPGRFQPLACGRGSGSQQAPISRLAVMAAICGIGGLLLVLPLRLMGPAAFLMPTPLPVLAVLAGLFLIPAGLLLSCIASWRIARSGGELRGFRLSLGALGSSILGAFMLRGIYRMMVSFHL